MKILFITTTNLATNPRLEKEIDLATSMGFEIELIQFKLNNWSDNLTYQIKSNFPNMRIIEIEAGRKPKFPWLISTFFEKIFVYVPTALASTKILSLSLNKRSYLIQQNFHKITLKPDLIIAHNLGSLYPAKVFAEKFYADFAVDIEDYHPGETPNRRHSERVKKLMLRILPAAKYVSFASNLIMEQIKNDFLSTKLSLKNPVLIDNVFRKSEFERIVPFTLDQSKLNLVWFSQNIDYSRGLESIFKILDVFQKEVTLTLIGNIRNEFYQNEIINRSFIQLVDPMSPIDLHSILPNFDIGLALETKRSNLNRDICLTNKIWAYLQSGIYVLASNTRAQEAFMKKFSLNGEILFEKRDESITQIRKLISVKEEIRNKKHIRIHNIDQVNWEFESNKLKPCWQ